MAQVVVVVVVVPAVLEHQRGPARPLEAHAALEAPVAVAVLVIAVVRPVQVEPALLVGGRGPVGVLVVLGVVEPRDLHADEGLPRGPTKGITAMHVPGDLQIGPRGLRGQEDEGGGEQTDPCRRSDQERGSHWLDTFGWRVQSPSIAAAMPLSGDPGPRSERRAIVLTRINIGLARHVTWGRPTPLPAGVRGPRTRGLWRWSPPCTCPQQDPLEEA